MNFGKKSYRCIDEKIVCINHRGNKITANFELAGNTCDETGILCGKVINCLEQPVKNALVVVYEAVWGCEILKMLMRTNDSGQFAFTKLPFGNYVVKICAMGYLEECRKVNITICQQIVDITVRVHQDESQLKGTVSGVITDESKEPIHEADVILYKVIDNTQSIPIDFTRTNEEGMYLFTNVDLGFYKITAK